jgi:hypothetical protein
MSYTWDMNSTTLVALVAIIVVATAAGQAFKRATVHQFNQNPAGNVYHSNPTREKASESARDAADRQRQIMDRVKEQMERNKH